MTRTMLLMAAGSLLLAAPMAAAPKDDPTRVVLKRYESRTGVKFRWFVAGKQMAEAVSVRQSGEEPSLLTDIRGQIPPVEAVEIDAAGRTVADWVVCAGPPLVTYKRSMFDPQGSKTYEFVPAQAGRYCPQTGLARTLDPKGNPVAEEPLIDGKTQRKALRILYPSGKLKSESWSVDGGRSFFRGYREDGTLQDEGVFDGRGPAGPQRAYDESGRLKFAYSMRDGEPDGPFVEYDAEGRKVKEGTKVRGKTHGEKILYRSDGSIKTVEHYDMGRLLKREER